MRPTHDRSSPTERVLRQFAALWLLAFGGMAAWQGLARANAPAAAGLATLALAVGLPGVARPGFVRPIFVGWMAATAPIRWAATPLLMAAIYYGLLVPVGLAMRALGRDELRLKPRPEAGSYWLPRPAPADLRRYFRQF